MRPTEGGGVVGTVIFDRGVLSSASRSVPATLCIFDFRQFGCKAIVVFYHMCIRPLCSLEHKRGQSRGCVLQGSYVAR
jgi:hypothetical protein